MASILKDMHFNATSLFSSNLLSGMNPLNIFKGPPVQTSFCFQKIHVHTSRHIFNNFPRIFFFQKKINKMSKIGQNINSK